MRQIPMNVAALTAGAVLMLAVQAHAVVIKIGTATGAAGSTASLSTTLSSQGMMVAGTQNDIAQDPKTPIAAKANGKPDCTASVKMDGSQFAFRPSGCTGAACTSVRAIIISFSDLSPIPDGAELYKCNIAIAADATGTTPLTCSGANSSDPNGVALATTCMNGSVVVGGGGGTPTATSGTGGTPTPTTGTAGTTIQVGNSSGNPGQPNLSIDVKLQTNAMVAGTQNDITFPKLMTAGSGETVVVKALSTGKPDCTAKVKMDGSQFAFRPTGCSGATCTGIRAIIISFSDLSPIPSGSTLYTCNIDITSNAVVGQTYPLVCSNQNASDPNGNQITAACTNGEVMVGGVPPVGTPTHTPTPTSSTPVVGTPTVTPTKGTPSPGGTATATPRTVPTSRKNDDDGCSVVAPANSQTGWILLMPAAILLCLRRRSR